MHWYLHTVRIIIQISLFILLMSCAVINDQYEAWDPDSDNAYSDVVINESIHTVAKNETLYAIAWAYNIAYSDILKWNNIENPNLIYPGQKIKLTAPISIVKAEVDQGNSVVKPLENRQKIQEHEKAIKSTKTKQSEEMTDKNTYQTRKTVIATPVGAWQWPASGKLLCQFKHEECKNGLHIAGYNGQLIYATAAGEVVYSGKSLRHYKTLILVKHPNRYYSAYANIDDMQVKAGDMVTVGQKIGSMGSNGVGDYFLFFQVRINGKPVNPINFLSKRKVS